MTVASKSIIMRNERCGSWLWEEGIFFSLVSDGGGESAATLYRLIGTAKLNGIDPEGYLRNVLYCIADHPVNRIEELLPWHVAANLLHAAPEAA
jgi:transposase